MRQESTSPGSEVLPLLSSELTTSWGFIPVIPGLKFPSKPNICRGGGQELPVCCIFLAGKKRWICMAMLGYATSFPWATPS